LLAAGTGVLLVAGCGAPEEPPPDAELLGRMLALELALIEVYGAAGTRPAPALRRRVDEYAERLRGEGAARDLAPAPRESGGDPLEVALALERRLMAAGLDAVGDLRDDRRRELAATLTTAAAQHESLLLTRLGRDPLATAFPDGRAT
jgi:hypothetical protein